MIITSKVAARAEVSIETLVRDRKGALQSIGTKLVRQVIAEGEQIGAMIREKSVRVLQTTKQVPGIEELIFEADWHPSPREGCLFLGGPLDGLTHAIDADEPLDLLRFPRQGAPAYDTGVSTAPTLANAHVYSLAGKDSERDCWVYEYAPEGSR